MLNSKATTDIVAAAESRFQQRLAKQQAAMLEKKKGTNLAPPSSTNLWAAQLEPTLVKTIQACMSQPEQSELRESLASALPNAVRQFEQVILAPESTVADRTRASNTIAWLFSVCTRTQVRLERAKTQKAVAEKKKAFNEAAAARAQRDTNEAVILIDKKRKKIQKTLDKVAAATVATFELPPTVDPKSKLARLLTQQYEMKQRQKEGTNGDQVTA